MVSVGFELNLDLRWGAGILAPFTLGSYLLSNLASFAFLKIGRMWYL